MKVRPDGTVKVLDFGLAKEWDDPVEGPGPALLLMLVGHRTHARSGSSASAAYMAPEQARGKAVDRRAYIWAFGVVLYEMLTGKLLFPGEDTTDVLAAVLRQEIDLSGLPSETPARTRWSSTRCLDRDVKRRLRDIGEARVAIEEELAGPEGEAFRSAPRSPRPLGHPRSNVERRAGGIRARRRWRLCLTRVGIAAVLGIAGLASYRQGAEAQRRSAERVLSQELPSSGDLPGRFRAGRRDDRLQRRARGQGPGAVHHRPRASRSPARSACRGPSSLLSISSREGELAVRANARYVWQRLFTGTLARVSLEGRRRGEILENVRQADWSPNGLELAIIREANGRYRLEFPIGTVLDQTAGYLSDLRVSPRGDRIALFEHPVKFDDRGSVIVVDRAGGRTVLSGDYSGEQGISWSRAGGEVLFTASPAGDGHTLFGVDLSGHRRVVLRSAGGLTVHDVSRTGRLLVTRDDFRDEISVLAPGARAERDLSWLDFSNSPFLSPDGRVLLFTDSSSTAGPNYAVCVRTTDGGPVVRLGAGQAYGLSRDGKWALAIVYTPPQLVIYPTGPGEPRRLPRGDLEAYQSASWFPDGKSVLFCGNEPGKASRCYAQDVAGGPPRPVTPEGTTSGEVSPDGRQILCSRPAAPTSSRMRGTRSPTACPV